MANRIKRCTNIDPVTFIEIFDADDLATIQTNYWNSSWGLIQEFPRLGAGSVACTTQAALCGNLAITFQNGRLYRVVMTSRALTGGEVAAVTLGLYDGTTQIQYNAHSHQSGNYGVLNHQWIIPGVGQTASQLHFKGQGQGVTIYVDPPSQFYVEDIGPVTRGSTGVAGPDWTAADDRYINRTGDAMTGPLTVVDEAYGTSWNGSLAVPTKNAVYDKIETVAGGGVSASSIVYSGSTNLSSNNVESALDELDAEKQPIDADLTAIAALTHTTSAVIQSNGATWVTATSATLKTSLALTKTDVGLSNVDNTSDANKPVSTATTTALSAKQNLDSDLTAIAALSPVESSVLQRKSGVWVGSAPATIKTDLGLTKSDVGLSSVDDTSDTNKPISSATQTALNAKANTAITVTATAPLTGSGTLGNDITLGVTPFSTTTTAAGTVPGSNNVGSTYYLSANGTWGVPPGSGAVADNIVTNAKLADMTAPTIKGRSTTGTGDPENLTPATVKTMLALVKSDVGLSNVDNTSDITKPIFTSAVRGLVPPPSTVTGRYLKDDGTWTIPTSSALLTRVIQTYAGPTLTASLADAGSYVRCTGTNQTYTIPLNATVAFNIGTQIDGVGTSTAMTLIGTAGVVINRARSLVTVAADSGWTLIKVDTDEWDAHGDFV